MPPRVQSFRDSSLPTLSPQFSMCLILWAGQKGLAQRFRNRNNRAQQTRHLDELPKAKTFEMDLRTMLMILGITNVLERSGDHAVNIAEAVLAIWRMFEETILMVDCAIRFRHGVFSGGGIDPEAAMATSAMRESPDRRAFGFMSGATTKSTGACGSLGAQPQPARRGREQWKSTFFVTAMR